MIKVIAIWVVCTACALVLGITAGLEGPHPLKAPVSTQQAAEPHSAPFLPLYWDMLAGKRPYPSETCHSYDLATLLAPCDEASR